MAKISWKGNKGLKKHDGSEGIKVAIMQNTLLQEMTKKLKAVFKPII